MGHPIEISPPIDEETQQTGMCGFRVRQLEYLFNWQGIDP
jgi:hypothetical protein